MADKLAVLNGEIEVGDRIAVAVSTGRYGNGMRVGEVLEVTNVRVTPGGKMRQEVKLRVEQSSGWSFNGVPYVRTFDTPGRMVKL
jgi:hypothetical protein